MYGHLAAIRPIDAHAHGTECRQRRQAVLAFQETTDPGNAGSQCTEHDGPV
jgi:hypothetical protein